MKFNELYNWHNWQNWSSLAPTVVISVIVIAAQIGRLILISQDLILVLIHGHVSLLLVANVMIRRGRGRHRARRHGRDGTKRDVLLKTRWWVWVDRGTGLVMIRRRRGWMMRWRGPEIIRLHVNNCLFGRRCDIGRVGVHVYLVAAASATVVIRWHGGRRRWILWGRRRKWGHELAEVHW